MIEVTERVGTVAELHGDDPFTGSDHVTPAVWWCRPTDDAVVLGSRQGVHLLDEPACARAGLSIVRRRSGGGVVVMRRSSLVWVDVIVPPGFAPDDVRGSMVWIGEIWRDVLASRTDRALVVHRGGLSCSEWSDLVGFSGVGPGEVLVDGAKLVGLSQRRTRLGIRIQGLVYSSSVAREYRPLFGGDVPATDPPGQAWLPDLDGRSIADELATKLTPV